MPTNNWQQTCNRFCMSNNFTNEDQLIQYLDGELTAQDAADLNAELARNPVLAAKLESLRQTQASIAMYGLRQTVGAIHQEMMGELGQAGPAPVVGMRQWLHYAARIAAVLVLLAGSLVVYQYYTATPHSLYNTDALPYQWHETRGATISTLETDYNNHEYSKVIQDFKQLPAPNATAYFLTANAALQTAQPAMAISALAALQQQNTAAQTHYYEEDVVYYLALAYLQNNEPAKALPLFETIYAAKDHPYHSYTSRWFMMKLRRLAR